MDEFFRCVARRTRAKEDAYIKQKHNQLIRQGIFNPSGAKHHQNLPGHGGASLIEIEDNPVMETRENEEGDPGKTSKRKRLRNKGRGNSAKEINIESQKVIGNGENEVGCSNMESKPDGGQHNCINIDNNDCLTTEHETNTCRSDATIGTEKSLSRSSEGVGSHNLKNVDVVVSTLTRLVDYSSDSSTSTESIVSNSSSCALDEDSDDVMDSADLDSPDECIYFGSIDEDFEALKHKRVERPNKLTPKSRIEFIGDTSDHCVEIGMNGVKDTNSISHKGGSRKKFKKSSAMEVCEELVVSSGAQEGQGQSQLKSSFRNNLQLVDEEEETLNVSLGQDLVKSVAPRKSQSQLRNNLQLVDNEEEEMHSASLGQDLVKSVGPQKTQRQLEIKNPWLLGNENKNTRGATQRRRTSACKSKGRSQLKGFITKNLQLVDDEEDETNEAPLGQDSVNFVGHQNSEIQFKSKNPRSVDDKKEKTRGPTLRRQTSVSNDYSIFEEFVDSVMDKGVTDEQEQANPFVSIDDHLLPLKFSFKDEVDPAEKTEIEDIVEDLFTEMTFGEKCDKIGSLTNAPSENPSELCHEDMHQLVLDEEVGLICINCHVVVLEIRYVMPPFKSSKFTMSERERDVCEKKGSIFGTLPFENQMDDSSCSEESNCNGTVWDMVPGVRGDIYPHQAEGLEFIWRNLEGTISINELKDNNTSNGIGGCIISHAPGTGKTRLAIVFIETYLKLFPKSRPVIIAPASMLLTWEEEFKKWKVNFPFHNLNKSEYSGKESEQAFDDLCKSNNTVQEKMRMVKLRSWYYKPSILGVSYNLYEKLAKEETLARKNGVSKRKKAVQNTNSLGWGKLLLDSPGLVILDEGHTPRNERSGIWKTLLKLNTKKRIILSGTPFQNNFGELFNTLHLVRPTIVDSLAKDETFVEAKRNYWKMKSARAKNEVPFNAPSGIWDASIKKLKEVIAPFVHVHKGSILQESLPGLIESVIILNPGSFQKKIIDRIERTQNTLELEHKLALVSVHPSLLGCCTLSAKEASIISLHELKKYMLNPSIGVKTRFVMELILLSDALKEKVLIFSQYIDPLALVKDHLKVEFQWDEGKEVLHIQGKMDQKTRQRIIDDFNNPKSDVKVLLASTKCCSEGINLVGASRVVLLDVVWNPSVERQAISRAYRLGQKKVVHTYHLIMAGTTEGAKLYRQAEKGWLSERVFSANSKEKDNNDDHNKRRNDQPLDDKVLEALSENNNLKDMFENIFQPREAELLESFGLGM